MEEKRELTNEEMEKVTGGSGAAFGEKYAEGAVSSTVEILRTLKEKTINAANDTNTDVDRASIQKPIDESIA